jgi:adenine-specific DNA-methyltransferase
MTSEPFASVFYKDGRGATLALESLMGPRLMDFPKGVDWASQFLRLASADSDVVLDFSPAPAPPPTPSST